ncbi:hypothetical protein F5050DRAFT_1803507 [Lentinula boryana]|uniref:JmjC domain-containing protein n=1 Tax=Lentinula boryana TaxID=40481 RepID=A0ABQ8QRC3_9AGAR|nr:hypothetical protein F5050DRAFT_1803507 [Lentinula boryana]
MSHALNQGDVHLNSETNHYWVYDGEWLRQETEYAFEHPRSKQDHTRRHTWNTQLLEWKIHRSNNSPVAPDLKGFTARKKRKVTGDPLSNEKSTILSLADQIGSSKPDSGEWEYVLSQWNRQFCRHAAVKTETSSLLNLLARYPVRLLGNGTQSSLLRELGCPTLQIPFKDKIIWDEFRLSSKGMYEISNKGMVEHEWTIGDVIEHWAGKEYLVNATDPYLNILEVFPVLEQGGLMDLGVRWAPEDSPSPFILDEPHRMTTTYTQPGGITIPHTDGFGYGFRVIHMKGVKVWLLWPPNQKNLGLIKRDIQGPRENDSHLSHYIDHLDGMEIWLVKPGHGDLPVAFELRSSTIHACISITVCAHSSVSTWRREDFDGARACNDYMKTSWRLWMSCMQSQKQKREEEDRSNNVLDEQLALIRARRGLEDQWDTLTFEFFDEWKDTFQKYEEPRWKELARLGKEPDSEILAWIKEVKKFLKQIRKRR